MRQITINMPVSLTSFAKRITILISSLNVLFEGLTLLNHFSTFTAQQLGRICSAVEALLTFCLVFFLSSVPFDQASRRAAVLDPKTAEEASLAITSTTQFLSAWRVLWGSWFVLYFLMAVRWNFLQCQVACDNQWVDLSIQFVNGLSTAFILVCYAIMIEKTADRTNNDRFMFKIFIATAVILYPFISFFAQKYGLQTQRDLVMGLLSGVALAVFVGRLESKLIDSPRWTTWLLYGYAVLQSAASIYLADPNTSHDTVVKVAIAALATFAKIILFWQVYSLIRDGTMIYYMHKYREMLKYGKGQRESYITDVLSRYGTN